MEESVDGNGNSKYRFVFTFGEKNLIFITRIHSITKAPEILSYEETGNLSAGDSPTAAANTAPSASGSISNQSPNPAGSFVETARPPYTFSSG